MADVAVILHSRALFTAGLGWLWLGVRAARTMFAASFAAAFGVTIMVGGAILMGIFG